MASFLKWVDRDAAAQQTLTKLTMAMMAKESRDELGVGAIRDSFSDLLFPGTSTIHTRLRYLLFIPWIFRKLEEEQVPGKDLERQAEGLQHELRKALLNTAPGATGIIGGRAKDDVKTLPYRIYWAALGRWGIRNAELSLPAYRGVLDSIYQKRRELEQVRNRAKEHDDDFEFGLRRATFTWDGSLPPAPEGFFGGDAEVDFALRSEEADYLREKLMSSPAMQDSLLSHLAQRPPEGFEAADHAWEIPGQEAFSTKHRNLLHHGRLFAELMHGAMISYNFQLACLLSASRESYDIQRSKELQEHFTESFNSWLSGLEQFSHELREWDLAELWHALAGTEHTIHPNTKSFVAGWLELVNSDPQGLLQSEKALRLVRDREEGIKQGASRFKGGLALKQWGGSAGMGKLDYRWTRAKSFLVDLVGVEHD